MCPHDECNIFIGLYLVAHLCDLSGIKYQCPILHVVPDAKPLQPDQLLSYQISGSRQATLSLLVTLRWPLPSLHPVQHFGQT